MKSHYHFPLVFLKEIKQNSFAFNRALQVALAVTISFIFNYFFSFSHEYWMFLSTFLVCQTTRGTPARQSSLIFILIFSALSLNFLLEMYLAQPEIINIIAISIFVLSGYFAFLKRPQSNQTYFFIFCFSIVLLITVFFSEHSLSLMRARIFDVIIGTVIGIVIELLFPIKLDKEFREGVLPILNALNKDTLALIKIFSSLNDENIFQREKMQIEIALQTKYPEWIYEVGFNRGLRAGFRFFLVNIERIAEIFFSINYLLSRIHQPDIFRDLHSQLSTAMEKNHELLKVLIQYFKDTKTTLLETKSDFTSDILELEKALNESVPKNIELLEISPNYLLLTELVRDVSDLRNILLQLVMSLPGQPNEL